MPNTPKAVDREALKEFRKRNDQRYVLEGEYSPVTKVGESDVADNLTPYSENSGVAQHKPFVFQSTASGSDVFALCQLRALRGQSYNLNQLFLDTINPLSINLDNTEGSETIYSSSIIGSSNYRMILGHKYLIKLDNVPERVGADTRIYITTINSQSNLMPVSKQANIITVDSIQANVRPTLIFLTHIGEKIVYNGNVQIFDLTQMFGAGNEPTTVEEFNRLFPLPYYEYNTGELVSSQASKLITVGYNQFDGEVEIGALSGQTGVPVTNSQAIRSKNFTKVIAGQTYTYEANDMGSNTFSNFMIFEYDRNQNYIGSQTKYSNNSEFELRQNTHYIKLVSYTNNVDASLTGIKIAFHLTWDGSKTGYESYNKHEYGLPNEVLRSAGSVYDEIKSNGTKITRIGVVDLGTLAWEYQSSSQRFVSYNQVGQKGVSANTVIANIRCSKYTSVAQAQTGGNSDKNIAIYLEETPYIYVTDKDYSDTAAFKSAMSGVYLFFELATPVESESIVFQENIAIDNWGTMEFVSTYPQGNEFFYYVDYKGFIDSLGNREDIGFDASKVVSHEELNDAMGDIDLSDYAEKSMVGFPVIPVPASITLTADEKAKIIKGARINGSFLGYDNIVFFPAEDYGGTYYGKYYVGGRPSREGTYSILPSGVISLTSDKNLRLYGIDWFNGKALPNYPSDTGTFVLKCVNGTLTWVQE